MRSEPPVLRHPDLVSSRENTEGLWTFLRVIITFRCNDTIWVHETAYPMDHEEYQSATGSIMNTLSFEKALPTTNPNSSN